MSDLFTEIKEVIDEFNKLIEAQKPALQQEVKSLIESKCTDEFRIEKTLDTLLSLTVHGMCEDLFIQLLEYYKTVSVEGAMFYWNEYDKSEEE